MSSSLYVIFSFSKDWGIYSEQKEKPLEDSTSVGLLRAWKMHSNFISVFL